MSLTIKTNTSMGWRPDLPDIRDLRFSAAMASAPKEFKPTMIIPLAKLPPVYDQLQTSSCVGNAGSTMFTYERKVTPRSRLQLYYEARRLIGETDRDEGCYNRDVVKVMSTLGAARETLWPFKPENVCVDPPFNVDRDAIARKIFKYARLQTRQEYLQCISEGHVFIVGISLYNNFMSPKVRQFGIASLPQSGEYLIGGHAVTCIGRDANFSNSQWAKEAIANGFPENEIPADVYVFRNSWGEQWGRRGNFVIPAAYLEDYRLSGDAWTVRKY